jgi:hypothetical protein
MSFLSLDQTLKYASTLYTDHRESHNLILSPLLHSQFQCEEHLFICLTAVILPGCSVYQRVQVVG